MMLPPLPSRNRTTGYGRCSLWTRLPFPPGMVICTKGCCLAVWRACSPNFADSLQFWFVLLLGCSWFILSTDLMMSVIMLIWWMTHILCCMLRLYFLNIFSTNHSQKENPTKDAVVFSTFLFDCWAFVESVCCLLSAWLYTYSTIQQKKNDVTGSQVASLWLYRTVQLS